MTDDVLVEVMPEGGVNGRAGWMCDRPIRGFADSSTFTQRFWRIGIRVIDEFFCAAVVVGVSRETRR